MRVRLRQGVPFAVVNIYIEGDDVETLAGLADEAATSPALLARELLRGSLQLLGPEVRSRRLAAGLPESARSPGKGARGHLRLVDGS